MERQHLVIERGHLVVGLYRAMYHLHKMADGMVVSLKAQGITLKEGAIFFTQILGSPGTLI